MRCISVDVDINVAVDGGKIRAIVIKCPRMPVNEENDSFPNMRCEELQIDRRKV